MWKKCDPKADMKVLMISSSYPQNAEDWRVRFVSNLVYAMVQKNGRASPLGSAWREAVFSDKLFNR